MWDWLSDVSEQVWSYCASLWRGVTGLHSLRVVSIGQWVRDTNLPGWLEYLVSQFWTGRTDK